MLWFANNVHTVWNVAHRTPQSNHLKTKTILSTQQIMLIIVVTQLHINYASVGWKCEQVFIQFLLLLFQNQLIDVDLKLSINYLCFYFCGFSIKLAWFQILCETVKKLKTITFGQVALAMSLLWWWLLRWKAITFVYSNRQRCFPTSTLVLSSCMGC